ncbi:MAG: TnpV protein, partial [Lawsonibacter sp.]|nr:TnpV protein [Lawsonibacter sp.]
MELTYYQEGDYLIPDLIVGDKKQYSIGKYGSLRRTFLKDHRPILYNSLCLSGKLLPHLAEAD